MMTPRTAVAIVQNKPLGGPGKSLMIPGSRTESTPSRGAPLAAARRPLRNDATTSLATAGLPCELSLLGRSVGEQVRRRVTMSAATESGPDDDELGPIDFLAVEFPDARITSAGFERLLALADGGVIGILDMEFVSHEPAKDRGPD
jgi:hypothetical protein